MIVVAYKDAEGVARFGAVVKCSRRGPDGRPARFEIAGWVIAGSLGMVADDVIPTAIRKRAATSLAADAEAAVKDWAGVLLDDERRAEVEADAIQEDGPDA